MRVAVDVDLTVALALLDGALQGALYAIENTAHDFTRRVVEAAEFRRRVGRQAASMSEMTIACCRQSFERRLQPFSHRSWLGENCGEARYPLVTVSTQRLLEEGVLAPKRIVKTALPDAERVRQVSRRRRAISFTPEKFHRRRYCDVLIELPGSSHETQAYNFCTFGSIIPSEKLDSG